MFLLLQKRDRFFKSFINKAVSQLDEQADKFLSHADVETKRRDDASWEKSCVNCRPEILLSLLFINLSYRNRTFFENLSKPCIQEALFQNLVTLNSFRERRIMLRSIFVTSKDSFFVLNVREYILIFFFKQDISYSSCMLCIIAEEPSDHF